MTAPVHDRSAWAVTVPFYAETAPAEPFYTFWSRAIFSAGANG
jgi:hypothetical protein